MRSMTALEIGLVFGGIAVAGFVIPQIIGALFFSTRLPAHVRKQRRREMLLTFSPGEWLWVTIYWASFSALLLWTLS